MSGARTGPDWERRGMAEQPPWVSASARPSEAPPRFGRVWVVHLGLAIVGAAVSGWLSWMLQGRFHWDREPDLVWVAGCATIPIVMALPTVVPGLRRERQRRRTPPAGTPWLADPACVRETTRRIGSRLLGADAPTGAAFALLLLVSWGAQAKLKGRNDLALVFLLLAAVPLFRVGRLLLGWWWHGRLVVGVPEAPVFVGGTAGFSVGVTPGGARIDDVAVELCCVREPGAWRVFGGLAPQDQWHRAAELEPGACAGPDRFLHVRIDVPGDLPGTDLAAEVPVCWDLCVSGTVDGRRYAERVRVPVYQRPAA